MLRTRFGEAASQMKKDGVRNPLAGAQVPKSQTSSDLRHKPALIHGVIGGAMTPAASRPPLLTSRSRSVSREIRNFVII